MSATVTLAHALLNAIKSEQAAEIFYRKLAERATNTEVQLLFGSLSNQEHEHTAKLQAVYDRLDLGDLPPEAAPDVVLAEAAPGQDMAEDLELPAAIEVALTAERNACAYYGGLAEQTAPPESTLFSRLARQEQGHIERLEQIKATIG